VLQRAGTERERKKERECEVSYSHWQQQQAHIPSMEHPMKGGDEEGEGCSSSCCTSSSLEKVDVNVKLNENIGVKLKIADIARTKGAVVSRFSNRRPIGAVERSGKVQPGMTLLAVGDIDVRDLTLKEIVKVIRRAHRNGDVVISFGKVQNKNNLIDDQIMKDLQLSPRTFAHRKVSLDADSGKLDIAGFAPSEEGDGYCSNCRLPFVPVSWQSDSGESAGGFCTVQ